MTKQEYEYFKAQPASELTDQDRKDLIDYERAEAKAPSLEDVKEANDILNLASKNPSTDGKYFKESGLYDKALKTLEQDRAFVATKGSRGMDAYVQPVKRIPDDLVKDNEFNFNWKSAYENQPGNAKLRDTEADYDKLKKFIDSKMYDLDDPVKLQEIAYGLHMYNPNTMKWEEFINSEQGEEFKKYLKDVQKYQKDKAVEKIWSGEDPTKVNYPLLGPTDVPGSMGLVNFGLPVAKEYAKRNYETMDNSDLIAPLAFDAATNAAMLFQPGSKAVSPVIARGSDFVAPAIQNIGQSVLNDQDALGSVANAAVGGAVNIGTPFALNRFNRYTARPGQGYSERVEIREAVDKIADKVGEISKRVEEGAVHLDKRFDKDIWVNNLKKVAFTDDPALIDWAKGRGLKVYPMPALRKYKPGRLTDKESEFYMENSQILKDKQRPNAITDVFLGTDASREAYTKLLNEQAAGKSISEMTKPELELLTGKRLTETQLNRIKRKSPDILKNYLTNAAGRSQMGTGVLSLPQRILGVDLGKYVEEKKKKKSSISEIFGE